MRLIEMDFLSHQPFRQRDKLPDCPDTKQDVRAVPVRAHYLIQKLVVNVECIHPDNQEVQPFQVIHVEITSEFRLVDDDVGREFKRLNQQLFHLCRDGGVGGGVVGNGDPGFLQEGGDV